MVPAMPLQNRVTPEGIIIATPERGTLMGNRGGRLHDDRKQLGPKRWVSNRWIACVLSFRGRKREVMAPGQYTELFFLDEATALSAGHRPCFECRRADAVRFTSHWIAARGDQGRTGGKLSADDMDHVLHVDRVRRDGSKATFPARLGELPDGTLVRWDGHPCLVFCGTLALWTPAGYREPQRFDAQVTVEVLTPRSIVEVIRAGYLPDLHESVLSFA